MPRRSTSPTRINLPDGYWLDLGEKNSPYWVIYWRDADGRRSQRSTETTHRADAEARFFEEFLPAQRRALAVSTPRRGDPLWDDLLDWYEAEMRHGGRRQAVFDNCKLLRRAVTGRHVSETDGAFWEGYKTDRRAGKYSFYRVPRKAGTQVATADATLVKELRCLKAILRLGIAAQKVNPALMPAFRMPKEPPPRAKPLDDAEMRNALARALALSPSEDQGPLRRITLVVYLLISTGGRTRAVELLTWDRVNWQSGQINLQSPRMTQNGKKNNATVPILPWLRPVLERAWRERTSEWVLGSRAPTWRVWTTFRDTYYPGMDLRRHDLRHSIATKLINDGVPLTQVAAFIGNTQRTTERVYVNGDKAALALGVLASVRTL
jgi:integrase